MTTHFRAATKRLLLVTSHGVHRRPLCSNPLRRHVRFERRTSGQVIFFHDSQITPYSTQKRKWNANAGSSSNGGSSQQRKEQQHQYHRLTSMYFTRKHYYVMAGIVFLGSCIVIHYFFPDHSLFDYVLKYAIYGGPYRDYVMLSRGAFLENTEHSSSSEHTEMMYIPHEMHFELSIPEQFVHPGLVLTEDSTYKTKGWVSMTDPLNQNLLVEWKEIMQQLNENEQTRFTPMDEILKGCAYMHVKELQDTLGQNNILVQRCEHVSMQKAHTVLDPLPFNADKERYGNMVCLVNKIHNPYKNEDKWEGDLWFMHTPYIFHVRLSYPSNLSQLALDEQPHEALEKYAAKISRSVPYQQQICSKVHPTNDPKEISLMLRNQLIQIYMRNKFKKHSTLEAHVVPPQGKAAQKSTEEEKSSKKGWFW